MIGPGGTITATFTDLPIPSAPRESLTIRIVSDTFVYPITFEDPR